MQKKKKYEFWIDSTAKQLIERENKLKRKIEITIINKMIL